MVVLLFVLSIFAVSIPIAVALAKGGAIIELGLEMVLRREEVVLAGPGSLPDPIDAEGHVRRGNTFRRFGHVDRAIADHTKAIQLDPTNAIAYNDRGIAYETKGNLEVALADYNKAIELDPKRAVFVSNRARVYGDKSDYETAIANYTKAIELQPDLANAHYYRGVAYYMKSDNIRAIADFTTAAELNPSNPQFVFMRGIAKYREGDFNGAAGDLSRSVELKANIHAILFRYMAKTRAGETAATEFEATVSALKTKDWPYVVSELFLGKRSPAATLDAATKADERCEAQFYVGQWYILNRNPAEAARALQIVADTCPRTGIEYGVAVEELKRVNR